LDSAAIGLSRLSELAGLCSPFPVPFMLMPPVSNLVKCAKLAQAMTFSLVDGDAVSKIEKAQRRRKPCLLQRNRNYESMQLSFTCDSCVSKRACSPSVGRVDGAGVCKDLKNNNQEGVN
jgi:hypothetical protein